MIVWPNGGSTRLAVTSRPVPRACSPYAPPHRFGPDVSSTIFNTRFQDAASLFYPNEDVADLRRTAINILSESSSKALLDACQSPIDKSSLKAYLDSKQSSDHHKILVCFIAATPPPAGFVTTGESLRFVDETAAQCPSGARS